MSENNIYNRYEEILGRMRDDKILSNKEMDLLNRDFLQTGTLSGIDENLSDFKANMG